MKGLRWRRASCACWVVVLLAVPSLARAEPRLYAVMSLLGDKLSVVTFRLSVGSLLDSNHRQEIPIADAAFDNAAALAAHAAIKRLRPAADVIVLASPGRALADRQEAMFDDKDGLAALAPMQDALRQNRITHLVLVTRYRAEVQVPLAQERIGSGKVGGLGFYIDRMSSLVDAQTGHTGKGYLMPYAYLRVALVDVKTLQALGQRTATAVRVVPSYRAKDKDAIDLLDLLSAAEKAATLRELLTEAIDAAVPALLAAE